MWWLLLSSVWIFPEAMQRIGGQTYRLLSTHSRLQFLQIGTENGNLYVYRVVLKSHSCSSFKGIQSLSL